MASSINEDVPTKVIPVPVETKKRVVKVRRVKKVPVSNSIGTSIPKGLTSTGEPTGKPPQETATDVSGSVITAQNDMSEKPMNGTMSSKITPTSKVTTNTAVLSRHDKKNRRQNQNVSQFFQRCASSLLRSFFNRGEADDVEDELEDDEEDDDEEDDDADDEDADEDEGEAERSEKGVPQTDREQDQNHSERYHQSQHDINRDKDIKQALQATTNVLDRHNYQQPATKNTAGTAHKRSATTNNDKPERAVGVQVARVPSRTGSEERAEVISIKHRSSSIALGAVIVKSINILLPIFFTVIAILHIVKIGQPQNAAFPQAVMQANKIAITLWPIMFAAIATQSLKTYATYQAERGIKLMTLEQLLHSSSFSSALKQPLLLRKISWASVALFLLWALSPLASQALQNMAYVRPDNVITPQNITYAMTGGNLNTALSGTLETISRDSLFGSAILSNKAQSPQDAWGYPRIPAIRSLSNPDAAGWYTVSETDIPSGETIYSSLMGTPYLNVSTTQDTQFTATTSYFSLNCTAPTVTTAAEFNRSAFTSSSTLTLWLRLQSSDDLGSSGSMDWASLIDNMDVMNGNGENGIQNSTKFALSKCNYESTVVSAQIACTTNSPSGPCSVTKIQPYNGSDLANYTIYWGSYALSPFLRAVSGTLQGVPTLHELYVSDPTKIMSGSAGTTSIVNLTSELFTERVQSLVNTFYQVAGGGNAYTEGLTMSYNGQKPLFTANGDYIDQSLVWDVLPYWVALFFFSNAIILLLAIADIICEAKTVSPDFLGFASNLVRNNQYLRKEMRGRKLGGHEKARALSDLCVMLQDDNGGNAKGKIVLAPRSANSVRLRKDRDYL